MGGGGSANNEAAKLSLAAGRIPVNTPRSGRYNFKATMVNTLS